MESKELEALEYVEELKLICREKLGAIRRLNTIETELIRLKKLNKIVELLIKEPSIVSLKDEYNSICIGSCMLQLPNEDYKYWKERFRNGI